MTDGQKREKELVPRRRPENCLICRGAVVLAETLPSSLGSPTYEIFRCQDCGAFDWVARNQR